jgi:hypothetical protein
VLKRALDMLGVKLHEGAIDFAPHALVADDIAPNFFPLLLSQSCQTAPFDLVLRLHATHEPGHFVTAPGADESSQDRHAGQSPAAHRGIEGRSRHVVRSSDRVHGLGLESRFSAQLAQGEGELS